MTLHIHTLWAVLAVAVLFGSLAIPTPFAGAPCQSTYHSEPSYAAPAAAHQESNVIPSTARQRNSSKLALNHNETLVSDTAPVAQAAARSGLLARAWACLFGGSSTQDRPASDTAAGQGNSSKIVANHNETLVSDAAR